MNENNFAVINFKPSVTIGTAIYTVAIKKKNSGKTLSQQQINIKQR